MSLHRAILALGLSIAASGPAWSQEGRVFGVVSDSAGKPVVAADVSIIAGKQLTRTDDQGVFRFADLPPGETEISVRRLGFQPAFARIVVTLVAVDSIRIVLAVQAAALEAVDVSAATQRKRQGVEEFYRRSVKGMGVYFTRADILARRASKASDMLRTTPGVSLVRTRSGLGVRFNSTQGQRRECMPMIWVDGQRAPGLEIDDLPVGDIEGIELYQGPATTPMQFSQSTTQLSCGTIVVWSRPPGL